MSFLSAIGGFFKRAGSYVVKAVSSAAHNGLNDQLVAEALVYVRDYATSALSNDQRREAVVGLLKNRFPFVPESVLRLAIELAVNALKAEVGKIG